jgi:hypothetical protein
MTAITSRVDSWDKQSTGCGCVKATLKQLRWIAASESSKLSSFMTGGTVALGRKQCTPSKIALTPPLNHSRQCLRSLYVSRANTKNLLLLNCAGCAWGGSKRSIRFAPPASLPIVVETSAVYESNPILLISLLFQAMMTLELQKA